MNPTGLAAFDSTLQTTNLWLTDIMQRMRWHDRHAAYHALRAVLHALRDRLTIDEVVALGAQLPMLVRGFYYDGWHPAGKPNKERTKGQFLARVGDSYPYTSEIDLEKVVNAVLYVLVRHVTAGEIESIKRVLPPELRTLFPKARLRPSSSGTAARAKVSQWYGTL
jgi:uncharacterized protein (DUF2267 family)